MAGTRRYRISSILATWTLKMTTERFLQKTGLWDSASSDGRTKIGVKLEVSAIWEKHQNLKVARQKKISINSAGHYTPAENFIGSRIKWFFLAFWPQAEVLFFPVAHISAYGYGTSTVIAVDLGWIRPNWFDRIWNGTVYTPITTRSSSNQ